MATSVPPARLSAPASSHVDRFVRFAVPFLAYAGLIYWLSAQSHLPVPSRFPSFSTYAHFVEYFGFGILVARGLAGYGVPLQRAVWLGALVCSFYGATDEYHQRYTPRRVPDVYDWVADTLGAGAGCSVWFLVVRRRA